MQKRRTPAVLLQAERASRRFPATRHCRNRQRSMRMRANVSGWLTITSPLGKRRRRSASARRPAPRCCRAGTRTESARSRVLVTTCGARHRAAPAVGAFGDNANRFGVQPRQRERALLARHAVAEHQPCRSGRYLHRLSGLRAAAGEPGQRTAKRVHNGRNADRSIEAGRRPA